MKLHAFILLMLVLTVSAVRRRHRGRLMPLPEGECAMVQPFDQDFVYTYKYVAITNHKDIAENQENDVRITCTAKITVPRRCSGKLRVSDCQLEEGKMDAEGRMNYTPLPSSSEFAREMEVSEMAFHFNGGQITRIFVDKQERANVTNFKRGLLSTLQAYNPDIPQGFDVGDIFEVSEVNVFGKGIVSHKVTEKSGDLPSMVEITREASRINLPWERRQWNFIRMRNNRLSPVLSAFKNYITLTNEERFAKSTQRCRYELRRGRLVASARCEEQFPLNPVKPEFASNLFETNPIETKVTQEITLKAPRRMTQEDRSQWDVSRFDEDSIMFEEEWEETNSAYSSGFNAEMTFLKLIREPINDKAPVLISKLSRWLAISSQEEIESVWAKCERECSEKEKTDGRILWVELLNSCISNDWCPVPFCASENATTCQGAMGTFVGTNNDKSPEIREACLSALEYIHAPSVHIIQTTLSMCRTDETTSPSCVRTLGILIKNFMETCENDCDNKKPVEDAKAFLVRQLKRDCVTRNMEHEEVMMVSLEMIGSFGSKGRYAEETVLTCAVNPNAPTRVVIKALVAYENITDETLNNEALTKIVNIFTERETKVETRIMSFHLLMKKNIPDNKLETILTKVMDDSDNTILTEHCRNDLRLQLSLRGTMFCQMHREVADKCVQLIIRNRWDVGIPHEALMDKPVQKEFTWKREMILPYINAKTNCTFNISSVFEKEGSIVPVMSKLTVHATVEGRNITILEAAMDIAGMKPVLDRIFGHNTFYADLFGKLLNTPVQKLHGYSKQYPAINALMEEGKFDYIRNIFNVRSPVSLKVFGYDISLDSLMSLDNIRRYTLGNVYEIIEVLEKGFEHNILVVGQPFLMQHATPTSIGAPMVSTMELSYIVKNSLNIKADLRKWLFSPNEKAVVNWAPEIFLTGSIRRTILEKFTESSGTELKFKFGHASAMECSVDSKPEGINAICTPKQGKTQLLFLSGKRSLTGRNVPEPSASVCQSYNLRNLCTVSLCKQPADKTGFAYEVDVEHHPDTVYHASIDFKSRKEEETRELIKELNVEINVEKSFNPSTRNVLWSSVIGFVPSRKEVQFKVECEKFRLRAAANMMLPMYGSSRGLFASVNVSGLESLEFKYYNVFRVVPESEKRYTIEGESKWAVSEGYKGYGLRGNFVESSEGTNSTKKIDMKIFDINRERETVLISSIDTKKVPRGTEGWKGYEVRASVEGSVLPWYRRIETVMATYDNGVQYDKVMKLSGHFENDQKNPHFFVHRIKGSRSMPGVETYDAELDCVTNWFHWEYKASSDSKNDVVQRAVCNFPDNEIPYNEIVRGMNPLSYNVETNSRPRASYIEYNFTGSDTEIGDRRYDVGLGYRVWDMMNREYFYEKVTVMYTDYKECSFCHSLEIKHPKMWLTSTSRNNLDLKVYQEEKWLKMHHSLLNYISLSPYISYYLISNMRNGYVEVGWRGKMAPKEEGGTKIELESAFLRNTANCSVNISRDSYHLKGRCMIDTEVIPLNMDTLFTINFENEIMPEMTFSCDARYAVTGYKLNGLLKLTKSNDFMGFLNATYGLYPSLEYEDILELSFDNVNSRYEITGAYKTLYRPMGTRNIYKVVGTSKKLQGGRRDFEIKAMCPSEPDRVCAKLSINKNDKIAERERLVHDNDFDRATIKEENNKYILTTDMVKEYWGERRFILNLDLNDNVRGIQLESKICNMSWLYSDENGLSINSMFNTPWLQYEMMTAVDSGSARWKMLWDSIEWGGARMTSNMTLNYVILNWDKPWDSQLSVGVGPKAVLAGIKIPDFELAWDWSTDRDRTPMRFKYFLDARIVPNKMILNELRLPLWDRDVEVKNMKLGWENRDDGSSNIFMRDISLSVSPECRELGPMIVTGSCDISNDEVILKIGSEDRSFVVDVQIRLADLKKHHIEFIITFKRSKWELFWDTETVNDKLITTGKIEVSMLSWKTKEMTPIFTIKTNNKFGETPEGANFPEIYMESLFTHSLPVPFMPRENRISFKSILNGRTFTTLVSSVQIGKRRTMEMSATMNGCFKRFEMGQRFSWCVPNDWSSNITFGSPSFRQEHITTIRLVNNEWMMKMTSHNLVPRLLERPVVTTISTRVEVAPCPSSESWCVPEQIEFKDMEVIIPRTFERVLESMRPSFISMYDFPGYHFERSNILFTRRIAGESSINSLVGTFRKQSTGEEIVATLTATLSPRKKECNFDLTSGEFKIKQEIELTWDHPNDIWSPWTYQYMLDSPWMKMNTDIEASSLIVIRSWKIDYMMPKGHIRVFTFSLLDNKLTFNVELETGRGIGEYTNVMSWNPETPEWEYISSMTCPWMKMNLETTGRQMVVNKCNMNLETTGMIKNIKVNWGGETADAMWKIGTSELKMTKRQDEWDWDLKCGRYPWMNQTLMWRNDREGEVANVQTTHVTQYHQCTSRFSWVGLKIIGEELDCKMKNSEAGIKVEYVVEEESRRCRMMWKRYDNTKISCLSTPMVNKKSQARFVCNKLEGTTPTEITNMAVSMQDFPFMGDYWIRDKILFVARMAEQWHKAMSLDETDLSIEYRKNRLCMDDNSCQDLAKRVKIGYSSYLREMKKIAGSQMYYATMPEITEYALYNYLRRMPGSLSLMPEWTTVNKYSPVDWTNDLFKGNQMTLMDWKIGNYLTIKSTASLDDQGYFSIKNKYSSDKYTMLNGWNSLGFGMVNGHNIINMTHVVNGMRYVSVYTIEAGKVYLIANEYDMDGNDKATIWTYHWDFSEHGIHNFTVMWMHQGEVNLVCDILTPRWTWSNTKVKCFQERSRQHLIGQFTAPDFSTITTHDFTNLDEILLEVLHVESPDHREKIKSGMRSWWSNNWDREDRDRSWKSNLYHRSAEYTLASMIHEGVKHMNNPRWLLSTETLMGFMRPLWTNWNQWSTDSVMDVMRMFWDAAKFVLEGEVKVEYKMENKALVVKFSVDSERFPLYNFETICRFTKKTWNSILLNMTTTNKFITMRADAYFDGPRIVIEKVRVTLPHETRQYIEMRFVPNPQPGKPFITDVYFSDMENQIYGCQGIRYHFDSPVMHMHCYVLDKAEFPPNPPASKMFAHYDIPSNTRGPFAGFIRISDMMKRVVNFCLQDPIIILKETYHVYDPAIRERLAKTIKHNCEYWTAVFIGLREQNEQMPQYQDESIVSLTRQYKSHSSEKLMSSAKEMLWWSMDSEVSALGFDSVGDAVIEIYRFWVPALRYAIAVAEYVEPTGVFKLSRCAECETDWRQTKMFNSFKSAKFPALNMDNAISMTSNGMMNTSFSNNWVWGWIEWKITGILIIPKRAKFGFVKNHEGVQMQFWPDVTEGERPTISFVFNAGERYRCDSRWEYLMMISTKCYPYSTYQRGSEVATCEMSLMKTWSAGSEWIREAIAGDMPKPQTIARAMEKVCEFTNSGFKEAVSNNLAENIGVLGDYWRNAIKDTLKLWGELMHSTWWNSMVDVGDWMFDVRPIIENLNLKRYFSLTKDWVESILAWAQTLGWNFETTNKFLYDIGYMVNKFIYEMPGYFPEMWHSESEPHYYQSWSNWLNILGEKLIGEDNCAFGMIHANEAEQVISLNNHMYNLPKSLGKCYYLLATELTKQYQVLLLKNDLVISLPDVTISVDPKMRVFEGREDMNGRREVPLPYIHQKVYCDRTETRLICYFTPLMTVVVYSTNNIRTGFNIKFNPTTCHKTKGLAGIGANTTEIPPMELMDGTAAATVKDFLDNYSVNESCQIGDIVPPPPVSHEDCDPLFENQQWKKACPTRRRSFMIACQTGARSTAEACKYTKHFNKMCHMEGRPSKFATICDSCGGRPKKTTTINKVQFTVIMSLSRRARRETLSEVLEAVRYMANQRNVDYEVSFVTFGGRDEKYQPAFHAIDGKVWKSSTEQWTIPNLTTDGPVSGYESLRSSMWYAFKNTRISAEGVGKVFLFVVPEDTDLTSLRTSTVVVKMNKDLIKSYLLIPKTCSVRRAKTSAPYGVRTLFTAEPRNICVKTLKEVAESLAYPYAKERMTCACKVENIFTGKITDECTHTD